VFFADLQIILDNVVPVHDNATVNTLVAMFAPLPLTVGKDYNVERLHFVCTFGREAKNNDCKVFHIVYGLPKLWSLV
jgi:hypothetical protein